VVKRRRVEIGELHASVKTLVIKQLVRQAPVASEPRFLIAVRRIVSESDDDEIDELHASLMAELASRALRAPVLVEMALVARFSERLGDHAVEVGRWIASFTATQQ
jgi:phosphate uptake regulator